MSRPALMLLACLLAAVATAGCSDAPVYAPLADPDATGDGLGFGKLDIIVPDGADGVADPRAAGDSVADPGALGDGSLADGAQDGAGPDVAGLTTVTYECEGGGGPVACAKTNGFGECKGSAPACDGPCDAAEPAAETCNGQDDDCDGLTDEELCADGDPCTLDTCGDDGACVHTPSDGMPCEDGNACTGPDSCAGGQCQAGATVDCDDQSTCTTDACEPTQGCVYVNAAAGTACPDDGAECTTDTCNAKGQCEHVPPKGQCAIAAACLPAGTKNPENGCEVCNPVQNNQAWSKQNGLPCNDGDVCTLADKCVTGVCTGTPVDCSHLDAGCSVGKCDGGQCVVANKDGPCDDGDPCTSDDACLDEQCTGKMMDCTALDDACHLGQCVQGACVGVSKPGSCDDGDPCTVDDSCATGACKGAAKDCSASTSACSQGVCEGGQCVGKAINDAGGCDDGNPCTTGDNCQNGQCTGSAKDCSALDDACGPGICANGQCIKEQQGVCKPGQVDTQSQGCGLCGSQTRTRTCSAQCGWGEWSAWSGCGGQGVCSPGQNDSQSQGCGNCGSQSRSRSCGGNCQWGAWGSWGGCGGQGVCSPGQTAGCPEGCEQKVCQGNCQWGGCGLKPGAACVWNSGKNYKCCGYNKWQFCSQSCQYFPCAYSATSGCK